MAVTNASAVSDCSKSGLMRATMKMPAVTIVAAWISAEIGVGPSIESGSHTCSGTWADLPIAPTKSSRQVKVISDQTEIRQGDCVMIEEIRDTVNIRRMDGSACDPKSQQAMKEVESELQEEAIECIAAKELLLKAETDEEIELAVRKIKLLCSN